ncbi:uncharacterized protein LOC144817742 [Lissotriton helveticus]
MSLNTSTGKSSLLTATGNSFGKDSTLGKVFTNNTLLNIPEEEITERPNDDCASEKDSDSEYACEAPASAGEPSSASKCVLSNKSSPAPEYPKTSPPSKLFPALPFSPGGRSAALKWLKSKESLQKIIHVYGLPPNGKHETNLYKICGESCDTLILFSENEAYVELPCGKAAAAIVRHSKSFPIVIDNHQIEMHYGKEIFQSLMGRHAPAPAPIKAKTAILKLPSGVHMKCGLPCVVWVFGHSFVNQAAKSFPKQEWQQVASSGKIIYHWMGFDGLRLHQLRKKVSEQQECGQFPFPDAFILHLGGEDLIHSAERKIKEDLAMEYAWLSKIFPDSLIVWSEIIPRPFWALGIEAKKPSSKRKRINRRDLINHTAVKINEELSNLPQFKCILYHNKMAAWSPLDFQPEGELLSDSGIDKFIGNVVKFVDSMYLWY